MLRRQENLSKAVCDIAWKAQLRLTGRFRRLVAARQGQVEGCNGRGDEISGFLWAIAREVTARA